MCDDKVIRRFAGTFILLSVLLAALEDVRWLYVTAFVGFNLVQSSVTGFCPLERILGRAGWFGCRPRSAGG